MSWETKNLIVEKDKGVPEKEIDLLTYFKDFAHSQHIKKQANITSSKRPSKLENFENSHFSITKFALAQTKLGKFYPHIKIIHFI